MAVEQAFALASIRQRDAAAQPHAAAHDDAAQGGLGVGDTAAQDGGGGGDVAIHEPADAGGKHVDPVAIRRSSVIAGEARQPDIDGALVTAGHGGEVVLHAVRDTERAAEVAAGARGDETERGKSGGLGTRAGARFTGLHQPVHDFVQRAVAAQADHEGPPLARGGGGQVRRLAGSGGRDDVELAQGVAQGAQEMRKVAAGVAATCGWVCDDEGASRGAGVCRLHEGKVPDRAARVRPAAKRAVPGFPRRRRGPD